MGIGGPYGALGASVEFDPIPHFGFVTGGGLGFAGPQVAAGIRARIPLGAIAIAGELTWSGGQYEWTDCHVYCFDDHEVEAWNFAHWLNASPALEVRTGSGFSARFYLGVAKLLNPGDGVCRGRAECRTPGEMPFGGVAFGGAF